ncbi:hypothetical protein FIC94_06090 [Ochrobactrum teleogrylli]|uniref:Mu-like prophage I protein n=2 Tax=Ochrobactrum teleogrylli TaxID=2479765 RepID=A0ABY2Y7Y6_9HYPH|nr:hypothetical protein FIC94_06090 [[Ochrobactrum] teleogrylli]
MMNLPTVESGATAVAPEWVHLMPAGTFSGADGRGPFVADDLQAIIARSIQPGRKLPIDINHSIDKLGTQGIDSPAVGWIVDMEAREDGIWGKVEWNARGATAVGGRDYGYLSPALFVTAREPRRVVEIGRASLTNDPNLKLNSLHTANLTGEPDMEEELRKALGLPEDADAAAILAAVTEKTLHSATLAKVVETAGVQIGATGEQIITLLQSRQSGDDAEKVELRKTVTELQSKVTTLTNGAAKDKAEAVIGRAIEEGKVVPALRDHFISRHMKNAQEVEDEIKLLPSLHSTTLRGYTPKEGGDPALTPEDRQLCELMGLDQAEFAKTKKSQKEML